MFWGAWSVEYQILGPGSLESPRSTSQGSSQRPGLGCSPGLTVFLCHLRGITSLLSPSPRHPVENNVSFLARDRVGPMGLGWGLLSPGSRWRLFLGLSRGKAQTTWGWRCSPSPPWVFGEGGHGYRSQTSGFKTLWGGGLGQGRASPSASRSTKECRLSLQPGASLPSSGALGKAEREPCPRLRDAREHARGRREPPLESTSFNSRNITSFSVTAKPRARALRPRWPTGS